MGDNLRDFELLSAAADILAVPHGLLVLGDDTAHCAGCGAHLAHLRRGETLAWWGRGTDSCADECPYQLSEGGGGPSPSPADGGAARGAAGSLADVADTCQGPGSGGLPSVHRFSGPPEGSCSSSPASSTATRRPGSGCSELVGVTMKKDKLAPEYPRTWSNETSCYCSSCGVVLAEVVDGVWTDTEDVCDPACAFRYRGELALLRCEECEVELRAPATAEDQWWPCPDCGEGMTLACGLPPWGGP